MNWFLIVSLLKQKMLLNLDKYCQWVVRSYSHIDMLFLINRILYLPVLDIKINLIFFFSNTLYYMLIFSYLYKPMGKQGHLSTCMFINTYSYVLKT